MMTDKLTMACPDCLRRTFAALVVMFVAVASNVDNRPQDSQEAQQQSSAEDHQKKKLAGTHFERCKTTLLRMIGSEYRYDGETMMLSDSKRLLTGGGAFSKPAKKNRPMVAASILCGDNTKPLLSHLSIQSETQEFTEDNWFKGPPISNETVYAQVDQYFDKRAHGEAVKRLLGAKPVDGGPRTAESDVHRVDVSDGTYLSKVRVCDDPNDAGYYSCFIYLFVFFPDGIEVEAAAIDSEIWKEGTAYEKPKN